MLLKVVALLAALATAFAAVAEDRFTSIVESAGESTVTSGGFVVNQKRVAVQKEITRQPPTPAELGVKLPANAALNLEKTARQIAQYHPIWRVYDYRVSMPRQEFIQFFEAQGLIFDSHRNELLFPGAPPNDAEFVDGLYGDPIREFRVWRRP